NRAKMGRAARKGVAAEHPADAHLGHPEVRSSRWERSSRSRVRMGRGPSGARVYRGGEGAWHGGVKAELTPRSRVGVLANSCSVGVPFSRRRARTCLDRT